MEELQWNQFFGLFSSGDVLVLNDSKVLWARLEITKSGGGSGEVFFLSAKDGNPRVWEVLTRNMRLKVQKTLSLPGGLEATVKEVGKVSVLEINTPEEFGGKDLKEYFEKYGQVPLPPYIANLREKQSEEDKTRYQTIWAKQWGSVAAPTAGLHFSEEHIKRLQEKGVVVTYVTLHVGAGTFLPVEEEKLEDFDMHPEFCTVSAQCCQAILKAQAAGKKVWACGTTVLRSLETAVLASPTINTRLPLIAPFTGETKLFVTPGFIFRVVDGLLTNFHQPQSTLLALVAAFATKNHGVPPEQAVKKVLKAYEWAIERRFRLFSYGDLTVIS